MFRTPCIERLESRLLLATTLHWQPLGEPGVGGWTTSVEVSPHNGQRVMVSGDMLGAGVSNDGGQTWGPTYGFRSWEQADFTFHPTDPNTIWLGTMSGPYVSTDGGVHWQERRTGFPAGDWYYSAPVQKVLFDPNNSNHLIAIGGSQREWDSPNPYAKWGAIWESTNGGSSWSLKSTIAPDANGRGGNILTAVFAAGSSTTLFAAVRSLGIYKSTNGGASWALANSGMPSTDVRFVAAHPTDPNTLWVSMGSGGGVYKTTNGGASWSAARSGLYLDNSSAYKCIAVSETNAQVLYTANADWSAGHDGLYRSTNGGTSWTQVINNTRSNYAAADPAGPGFTWVEIDPNDANHVFASGSAYVLGTTNGGSTWTDMTAYRPTSDTKLWRGRGYTGWVSTNFAWNPYKPGQMVVQAMDAGKMWVSNDSGYSWRRQSGISDYSGGNDVSFSQTNPNLMFGTFGQFGYYDAIAKSTDGGATWSSVSQPAGSSGTPLSIYMHPTQNNRIWVTVGGLLYYSSNSGSSWTNVNVSSSGSADTSLGWIEADPTNPLTLYLTSAKGIYKSTDGASFSLMAGSPTNSDGGSTRMTLDPSSPSRLYVVNWRSSSNAGVYRYTPAGGWVRISTNAYAADIAVDPAMPDRIIFTTNDHPYHDFAYASGVYLTENGLSATPTWTQQNDQLPMLRGSVIRFAPDGSGDVVLGTYGRGYFRANIIPPAVNAVTINAGQTQRSMVTRLDVTFSEPVTLAASAITVKLSTGATVPGTTISVANPSGDQKTYALSFSGSGVIGGSLADGIYDVVVTADGVKDLTGNPLTANYTQRFHRLFGDSDGNKIINSLDYARLKQTFGRAPTDPLFNSAFDYEGNNLINALDLARFRQRYGMSLIY